MHPLSVITIEDNYLEIASKIFYYFGVAQSCTYGIDKGILIWEEILAMHKHTYDYTGKCIKDNGVPFSTPGCLVQKIFVHKKDYSKQEFIIYRYQ